jgi:hypothetical protein
VTKTYDARLATRITASTDARLRQLALAARRPISHVLDDVLDAALPTGDELAARLRKLASTSHAADARPAPNPARAGHDADGHDVAGRPAQAPAARADHDPGARPAPTPVASARPASAPAGRADASDDGEPAALTSPAIRGQR